jgi:hypothetical protein
LEKGRVIEWFSEGAMLERSAVVVWGQHPSFEVFRSNPAGPSIEQFDRSGLDGGNKSTVNRPLGDGRVAIFPTASTGGRGIAIFRPCGCIRGTIVFRSSPQGIGDMRQVNSFLRSASSRIGRRFAQIVAIAAASLPAAGA